MIGTISSRTVQKLRYSINLPQNNDLQLHKYMYPQLRSLKMSSQILANMIFHVLPLASLLHESAELKKVDLVSACMSFSVWNYSRINLFSAFFIISV